MSIWILSIVSVFFSHAHCELDTYCPFVMLLQIIEKRWLLACCDISYFDHEKENLKNIFFLIDRHCSSTLHFTDFSFNSSVQIRSQNRGLHLTTRTRKILSD